MQPGGEWHLILHGWDKKTWPNGLGLLTVVTSMPSQSLCIPHVLDGGGRGSGILCPLAPLPSPFIEETSSHTGLRDRQGFCG